jgi:hypothetical protein
MTLTAIAHAAGELSVVAARSFPNDAGGGEAKITVSVNGNPLPDLEPRWSWVQVQRPAGRPRVERSISGSLRVTNWGTAPAQHPRVRFYLVKPGEVLERKRLLRTLRLDTIEPGKVDYATLHARLPLDLGPLHGQLLAVVDEPDQIPESIKSNNRALSGDLAEEKK